MTGQATQAGRVELESFNAREVDQTGRLLREIGAYPMLTHEEEVLLSRQVWRMQRALEKPMEKRDDKDREDIELGIPAKRQMIRANLRLVVAIAKKYVPKTTTMTLRDLINEGTIGLEQGISKFDPRRGYRLSTYIYFWIRQKIVRAIKDRGHTVRRPVYSHDNYATFLTTEEALTKELKRKPTIAEVSERCGISVERLKRAITAAQSVQVLSYDHVEDGFDNSVLDTIADPLQLTPAEEVEKTDTRDYLEAKFQQIRDLNLIEDLERVNRAIEAIQLKFGWDGQIKTYVDFAADRGVPHSTLKNDVRLVMGRLRRLIERDENGSQTKVNGLRKNLA